MLAPAAWTLAAARVDARTWVWFAVGALAYASGHGIHLAANSIDNASPGATSHLWDEVVGHAIWYAGVALVVVALARAMSGHPRPPVLGYLLAVAVGVTWATNAIGTDYLALELDALVVAAGFAAYGWRHRDGLAVTLLVGFVPAALWLVMHLMLAD